MGCCSSATAQTQQLVQVKLDPKRKGKEAKVAGKVLSGIGAALASAALHQDAAFWEFKIVSTGTFCIGVSRKVPTAELDAPIGNNKNSWGLHSGKLQQLKPGDIIGCAYGQSDRPMLSFYHNGTILADHSVQRIRGLVYPAVSVSDGASLEANFSDSFTHPPPSGYSGIIPATDMI